MLNLLTTSADELEVAFDVLEGDGFYKKSCTDRNVYSIYSVRDAMMKSATNKSLMEAVKVIYGTNGVHRFFVKPNGDIQFSKSHQGFNPRRDAVKDAMDLGFELV